MSIDMATSTEAQTASVSYFRFASAISEIADIDGRGSDSPNQLRNHVNDAKNGLGKLLPV